MKLYDNINAPNPRRVRIFMAEKGVTCDNTQLDIVKGENLSDDFLAINPRGLLPTLVLDDGTVIDEFDSAAFLEGAIQDVSTDPPFTLGEGSRNAPALLRCTRPSTRSGACPARPRRVHSIMIGPSRPGHAPR